jgi:hypothetical protein
MAPPVFGGKAPPKGNPDHLNAIHKFGKGNLKRVERESLKAIRNGNDGAPPNGGAPPNDGAPIVIAKKEKGPHPLAGILAGPLANIRGQVSGTDLDKSESWSQSQIV